MKYNEEQIKLTQEAVEKIIFFFEHYSDELIEKIKSNRIDSFHTLLTIINKEFKSKFKSKFSLFDFNKIVNNHSLSSGAYTFISFYLLLFLISKGLEHKFNYKIQSSFFKLMPYTSISIMLTNSIILGRKADGKSKFNLNLRIPLLIDRLFVFGKGGCPYVQGKEGKNLNERLNEVTLQFLELLYSQILIHIAQSFEEKDEDWTPDFVNYLLGRFKEVNIQHLEANPKFFIKC